jgi:hypothetical protein
MKFNEEQIDNIMYDGGIYDENTKELLYQTVDEEIIDTDTEKSSTTIAFVVKEISTGKFFSAELDQSPWCMQKEYNAKTEWEEVKPEKVMKTIYK